MSLADRLVTQSTRIREQARAVGLPVESVEAFFDTRVRPRLVRTLSTRAIDFVRRTGVKIEALAPGHVRCRMPLKGNVNHIGTMYAGALFTLAEFPGGPLLLATYGLTRFVPIVTALDMAFVRAAKSDVRVELHLAPDEIARIEAETLAEGRSIFELQGELRDMQGELVARSHAVYQMRPRRR